MKTSFLKPYWSRQHGAYITLFVSWLLSTCLSSGFTYLHIVVLLCIMSGLNLAELIVEALTRKTRLQERKRFWMITYAILFLSNAMMLYMFVNSFVTFLPVFVVFGLVFIFLAMKKQQKGILSEWLTFSVFSLAGLLALNPSGFTSYSVVFLLWLLMSSYFGLSVFLVKVRFLRLSNSIPLLYSILMLTILFMVLGPTDFLIVLSLIFLIKSIIPLLLPQWYLKLPVKWIGIQEMGFHLVFAASLIVFSDQLLSYSF